jgi:hypothetical protein
MKLLPKKRPCVGLERAVVFTAPCHWKAMLPTAGGGSLRATQPTSVTALGRILVGDGRIAAGASELGPAMSDGQSGFLAQCSLTGPKLIAGDPRRRGRVSASDYAGSAPGLRRPCEADY